VLSIKVPIDQCLTTLLFLAHAQLLELQFKMAEEQPLQYFNAKYLDPKFPIVKPDPSVDDVVKGMRSSDYLFVSGVMAGTYTYGYLLGKPVRGPTAVMCASAGFTFAMFHTMQTVRSRFLGYRENSKEVKKYGLAPVQPQYYSVPDRRFPVRDAMVTQKPLDWDKY
jgi:NADH-ubiquinone oxidoreductase complex I, 21 kDa subunit